MTSFAADGKRPHSDNGGDKTNSPVKKRKVVGERDEAWNAHFAKLTRYKDKHGNCLVPGSHKDEDSSRLGIWVKNQRFECKKGILCDDRIERLNSIGFAWSVHEKETFDSMCVRLAAYKEEKGNCNVPAGYKEDPKLANWVVTQRQNKKKGKLLHENVAKLDSLGFMWTVEESFDSMFARLVMYKEEKGDCNVPAGYKEDPKLGNWVHMQRQKKKKGKLSDENVKKLDSMGFTWKFNRKIESFDSMCARLATYKEKKGNCDVPGSYKEDPKLAKWVTNQRQNKKAGKLSDNQIAMLESMGFQWSIYKPRATFNHEKFDSMCARLAAYKEEKGDCNVPQCYKEDPKLANWVMTQRQNKKKGKLSDENVAKLESMGFIWKFNRKIESFDSMCARLTAYKEEKGNCNVPAGYREDPKLAKWVNKQRQKKKTGKLSDNQIALLESMGFQWSIHKPLATNGAAKPATNEEEGSTGESMPQSPILEVVKTQDGYIGIRGNQRFKVWVEDTGMKWIV